MLCPSWSTRTRKAPSPKSNGRNRRLRRRSKVEGNGSALKGDTVDLLSDSEEEAGAALQPEAALVQDDADLPAPPAEPEGDKDHVDVLRVQQPWLDMLLDGHKTWELRTTRVDESRSPHRLGH